MKRATALTVSLFFIVSACGDSAEPTVTTSPPPVTQTSQTPSSTSAPTTSPPTTTTTTTPPSTAPPATTTTTTTPAAVTCETLAQDVIDVFQATLDGLGAMTLEELTEFGDDGPPVLEELSTAVQALDDAILASSCDPSDVEALATARFGELMASGPVGELFLSGLLGPTESPRPEPPAGVEYFEIDTAAHSEGTLDYDQDPPTGGVHAPIWQACGFYDQPVPKEQAVHSLEHGAVWITYDPTIVTAEDLVALEGYATETKVLVSPYTHADGAPVVATVWGAQMRLASALDPQLDQFILALREATAPEAGAPCAGGATNTEG